MPATPERPSPQIGLVPATLDQEPVLANLLELYAHDFSEFHPIDLHANGRFGYKNLSRYWNQIDHHPFLVQVDGKLAGFVFVKKGSEISGNASAWDVQEFFIVRAYRRRGIGISVAHQVWKRFAGPWEVRVMESNRAALNFWQQTIKRFIGTPIDPAETMKGGETWYLFSFECKRSIKE